MLLRPVLVTNRLVAVFMCSLCDEAGEGHYLYNLRIIPTVEKKINQKPTYNYEFSFQESLHKAGHNPSPKPDCDSNPSIS